MTTFKHSDPQRSFQDYEVLCDRYLTSQDKAQKLQSLVGVVLWYMQGHLPANKASRRREDFRAAATAARRLRQNLSKLDLPTLAAVMGRLPPLSLGEDPDPLQRNLVGAIPGDTHGTDASTPTSTPGGGLSIQLRLVELAQFADLLDRVTAGLSRVTDDASVRASRPPTSDPLSFGVEALAALWRESRGTIPTGSFNAGEFGDFAINIFGPKGLKFTDAEVRTAVRRVISSQYQA